MAQASACAMLRCKKIKTAQAEACATKSHPRGFLASLSGEIENDFRGCVVRNMG